jgi:lactoylglutathione lyase
LGKEIQEERIMGIRIDLVGIFVNNLTEMVTFYKEVLGFEINWDGQGPYAEFINDGVRFSMYQRSELTKLLGQEPSYPAGINGTFEIAIDFPTSSEADIKFLRVVEQGAKVIYSPRDEPWGMHSSMIADPEGNLIEIGSWNRHGP